MSENVDSQIQETTRCANALRQALTMRTDTLEKAKLLSLLAAILAVRDSLLMIKVRQLEPSDERTAICDDVACLETGLLFAKLRARRD